VTDRDRLSGLSAGVQFARCYGCSSVLSVGSANCGAINVSSALNVAIVNTQVIRNGDCFSVALSYGGQVLDSVIAENNGWGIRANGNVLIRGNIIRFNRLHGIELSDLNAGGERAMVENNLIVNNGGTGIRGPAAFSGNVISDNGVTVDNGAVEFGRNFCDGNTTCP